MCGCLGGYLTIEDGLNSLKKLFYRGIDSFGIASFNNNKPVIYKQLGKEIVSEHINKIDFGSGPKLFHNRWASSGEVCINNTHPFCSQDLKILLIHNGQITNSKEIQKNLEEENIKQVGETDSETACNWIAKNNCRGFANGALPKLFNDIFNGTWAIIFLDKNLPNVIYFLVKDSPLYYYNGQLSSDPSLFPLYYTIPNNSWGYVSSIGDSFEESDIIDDKYYLYVNGNRVCGNWSKIYVKNDSYSEKTVVEGENKMLSEIKEQATIDYQLDKHGREFLSFWLKNKFETTHMFGQGSSLHAAYLGKKYFESVDIQTSADYASEYDYYRNNNIRQLKIAITQSGETADVKEVVQKLWGRCPTLLLTNKKHSSCSQWASKNITLDLSTEEAVAATKTFSATCLNLLTFSRYIKGNFDINFEQEFKEKCSEILENSIAIQELCGKINRFAHMLILGTDYQLPIAYESALKLKECSLIHAEGLSCQNYKHGCLSLTGKDTLIIFLLDSNKHERFKGQYDRILGNAEQCKARNGVLLGIGPEKEDMFDFFIKTPKVICKEISPLVNNVVTQLMSFYLAKDKGLNPDYPFALAKAITVY